jgi:hypothetical protein
LQKWTKKGLNVLSSTFDLMPEFLNVYIDIFLKKSGLKTLFIWLQLYFFKHKSKI